MQIKCITPDTESGPGYALIESSEDIGLPDLRLSFFDFDHDGFLWPSPSDHPVWRKEPYYFTLIRAAKTQPVYRLGPEVCSHLHSGSLLSVTSLDGAINEDRVWEGVLVAADQRFDFSLINKQVRPLAGQQASFEIDPIQPPKSPQEDIRMKQRMSERSTLEPKERVWQTPETHTTKISEIAEGPQKKIQYEVDSNPPAALVGMTQEPSVSRKQVDQGFEADIAKPESEALGQQVSAGKSLSEQSFQHLDRRGLDPVSVSHPTRIGSISMLWSIVMLVAVGLMAGALVVSNGTLPEQSVTISSEATSHPETWPLAHCLIIVHVLNGEGQGLAMLIASDPAYEKMDGLIRAYANHFGLRIVVNMYYPVPAFNFVADVKRLIVEKPNRIILCGPTDSYTTFRQAGYSLGLIR